jgi:hypothetical protein
MSNATITSTSTTMTTPAAMRAFGGPPEDADGDDDGDEDDDDDDDGAAEDAGAPPGSVRAGGGVAVAMPAAAMASRDRADDERGGGSSGRDPLWRASRVSFAERGIASPRRSGSVASVCTSAAGWTVASSADVVVEAAMGDRAAGPRGGEVRVLLGEIGAGDVDERRPSIAGALGLALHRVQVR